MKTRIKRFLTSIGFLAMVTGFSAVIMLLWNWLIPAIFGLDAINFWQVLVIISLCGFIVQQIWKELVALGI